jgi:hypothetical protein
VYLILQQKLIVQIEKKTYNIDETRMVNADRLWIRRKINFQLEARRIVTMAILKKWLAE